MGLSAMTLYRAARRAQERGLPWVPGILRKVIYLLHNAYVPSEASLGEGTELGYGGMGVVIHPGVQVGKRCLISQQVTLGGRSGKDGVPIVGDYVRIGAGAKVLGPVRIGDFAVIGANAVVVHDVAPGAIVAGVPARELRRDPNPAQSYARDTGKTPEEWAR